MSKHFTIIAVACLAVMLTSCGASRGTIDYTALARAGLRLGIDIDRDDDHRLYVTASEWIGTPYKYGGTTQRGVDCSGFVRELCREVYGVELSRTADSQRKEDCRKVRRSKLDEGDLVFFKNARKSRTASHVGIYLKDNKFIHASTSGGVIVSDLREPYYDKTWLAGGRLK